MEKSQSIGPQVMGKKQASFYAFVSVQKKCDSQQTQSEIEVCRYKVDQFCQLSRTKNRDPHIDRLVGDKGEQILVVFACRSVMDLGSEDFEFGYIGPLVAFGKNQVHLREKACQFMDRPVVIGIHDQADFFG